MDVTATIPRKLRLFRKLLFALTLVIGGTSFGAISEPLISQSALGPNGCGPTALLYAFKAGPLDMKKSYMALDGETDAEKLKAIVQSYGRKESKTKYHQVRYDPDKGMAPLDLFATADDLLKNTESDESEITLGAMNFSRMASEEAPGAFVRRVHKALVGSLAAQVPVIAVAVPYLAHIHPKKKVDQWAERPGHYIVITKVNSELPPHALGFTVSYRDPATGWENQALVYEEVERSFLARHEKGDGKPNWIKPAVLFNKKKVISPYLVISAPGLNLVPKDARHSDRLVIAITDAWGRLN